MRATDRGVFPAGPDIIAPNAKRFKGHIAEGEALLTSRFAVGVFDEARKLRVQFTAAGVDSMFPARDMCESTLRLRINAASSGRHR